MKIGVAGAGAVGSLFGALLANAHHEVTFLARGKHLTRLQERGIKVVTEQYPILNLNNEQTIFTNDIHALASVDILLFCVKSTDTKKLADSLKGVIKDETMIVTMQNGVDNEEILARSLTNNKIFSCATYVQASITEPGCVKESGSHQLLIGALQKEDSNQARKMVDLFQRAGISAKFTEEILNHKWKKLLWNITFNPLSAITKATIGEILESVELSALAKNVAAEAVSVAARQGYPFDKEKVIQSIFKKAAYAKDHQTSMLQDRLNGKAMEYESMCGYVLKLAHETKIEVPTIMSLYSILKFWDEKERRKDYGYVEIL
ncbi:ketopantoate reductase family protein [Cytobacillus sp. FSL R7-0680]|uniref:ketopantoate reductase family protein n=1 Tax=Cytobacillus sp. FSL R7-0680 TaxID=2921689 RepID=UPI0030F769D7